MSYLIRLNALQLYALSSFCIALIKEYSECSLENAYNSITDINNAKIVETLRENIRFNAEMQSILSLEECINILTVFDSIQQDNKDLNEILKIPSIICKNERMSQSFVEAKRYLLERKDMQIRASPEGYSDDADMLESGLVIASLILNDVQEVLVKSDDDWKVKEAAFSTRAASYADVKPQNNSINPPAPVPRYLQTDVPERVRFGDRFSLLVRIVLANTNGSSQLRAFNVPNQGVEVKITVNSSAFAVFSQSTQVLHVPADTDSDPLLFELEARETGIHKLEILAFNGGAFLGSHNVQITIDNVQTEPPVRQQGQIISREAVDGETTLTVKFDVDSRRYRYVLRSHTIGQTDDIHSGPLSRPREKLIQDFVETLNTIARGKVPISSIAARFLLKGKGKTLWDEIIPDELKHTFYKYRESIKQLNIICGQDPIPWEVLYPTYEDDKQGFLAEQFPVTRWRPGPPPTPNLDITKPLFVLPDKSPERAQDEVLMLKQRLKGGRLVETLEELIVELQAPQCNVLHFACHNTFVSEKPLASYINMGGSPFVPDILAGIGKTLQRQSPLVFMNACRTAGSSPTYTQLSGWADTFLASGAAAFIGSLWEIRDSSAPIFAQKVYDSLLSKTTLGEAVLNARKEMYEDEGDPTRLAYALYGNANATAVSVEES